MMLCLRYIASRCTQLRQQHTKTLSEVPINMNRTSQRMHLKEAPNTWQTFTGQKSDDSFTMNSINTEIYTEPLCILLTWFMARPRHVEKYKHMYESRGFTVKEVKFGILGAVWPMSTMSNAKTLLEELISEHKGRPLVFHIFSAGLVTHQSISRLIKQSSRYEEIKNRICGQVFDSPNIGGADVYTSAMVPGITSNVFLQYFLLFIYKSYALLTYKWTVRFLNTGIKMIESNPFQGPVLFYYSLNDKATCKKTLGELIGNWKLIKNGDVLVKMWEDSPHVQHLRSNPDDYLRFFDSYFAKVVNFHAKKVGLRTFGPKKIEALMYG